MKAEITSRLYFVYLDNTVLGIIILKVVATSSSISKIRVWQTKSQLSEFQFLTSISNDFIPIHYDITK